MRGLVVLGLLILAGCESTTQPFDFSASDDALARAAGGLRWSFMGNSHYDAAFLLDRREQLPSSFSYIDAHAAFNRGSTPIQIGSAYVNGVWLAWNSRDGAGKANSYSGNVPSGLADSVRLEVTGFDGDDFYGSTRIAPDFDFATIPDTLDIRTGWTLKYANIQPKDSITVQVFGIGSKSHWSYYAVLPDTGMIVIPRDSLPVDDSTTWLGLQLHRTHMDSLITARGHRIGVASWQTFGPTAWPIRK